MCENMVIKRIISYTEYSVLLEELINLIKKKYDISKFDYIYGPPRGGLPIAVHLSYHLNIKFSFKLKHFNNILIVDDIVDSGNTFTRIKHQDINNRFIFASLFSKPRSNFQHLDDNFVELIENNIWIQFPWESNNTEIDKEYMNV